MLVDVGELRRWLGRQPLRLVPLFAEDGLVVDTHVVGKRGRRVLRRHPEMEAAVISEVDSGFAQASYVGKAGRSGKKHPVSANLKNLDRDKSKFARWGDGVAYHVGDLSHVLFRWDAYKKPSAKHDRWADMLVVEQEPPVLRSARTSL